MISLNQNQYSSLQERISKDLYIKLMLLREKLFEIHQLIESDQVLIKLVTETTISPILDGFVSNSRRRLRALGAIPYAYDS